MYINSMPDNPKARTISQLTKRIEKNKEIQTTVKKKKKEIQTN